MIDEEISRIVRDSQRLADEILRKDIDILHNLAKELLKYETLDSKDLEKILEGKKLTRPLNESFKRSSPRRRQKRNRSNGSNITTDNNLNILDKSPEKPDTKSSQKSIKTEIK